MGKCEQQIAIKNCYSGLNHAYVTKRWRIVAWFLKVAPDFIYLKL